MSQSERDAVAAICLLAAFADGEPDDKERNRIRTVMDGLSTDAGSAGAGVSNQVYQRVIFKQTDGAREAAQLSTPEMKKLAYEMAVSVCDADGVSSAAEQAFLASLAGACGVSAAEAASYVQQVNLITDAPVGGGASAGSASGLGGTGGAAAGARAASAAGVAGGTALGSTSGTPAPLSDVMEKEIDGSIANYAILNGALELLPQGLASAAIIPLQIKMVYEIGKRYGYTLDKGHIKDFLATAGVGMTSQVVESFARRLVGGLLENVAGRVVGRGLGHMVGNLGRTATGGVFTFASTYALGQVARQYYAGGRKLSAIDLRTAFTKQVTVAEGLYGQYRPKIEEQARKVNPMQLLSMVRG